MIRTFTGPMHSGKTKKMMDVYFGIYNKEHILCFNASKNDRDGNEIRSKDYEEGIPCIGISKFEEILDFLRRDVRTIFIDEAQMIEGNVAVLSNLSINFDIDIYIAGLNMTSEQTPFMTMPYILAISDEIDVIKASCYDCGRDALFTYYEGVKTEDIQVGDEGYFPLCHRCLSRRREESSSMKLTLKKDTNNKVIH